MSVLVVVVVLSGGSIVVVVLSGSDQCPSNMPYRSWMAMFSTHRSDSLTSHTNAMIYRASSCCGTGMWSMA